MAGSEQGRASEAERALIGALLLEPAAYSTVAALVSPTQLADRRHRTIYEAIAAVAARTGCAPDAVLVADELARTRKLTRAGGRDYLAELVETTPGAANIEAWARAIGEHTTSGVRLVRGADVRPRPIEWLWEGWLARGKLHVIAGAPGTGKTTLATAIEATLSSGGRWPDGSRATPDNVLVWSGEDDAADTLVPRLRAMDADMERVYFVRDVVSDNGKRPFDPSSDMEELYAAARRIGSVGLIILDPIVSAVAGDSHKNGETRRALQPVVDLAAALNAAVLGISHYTKGTQGRDPIERVTGSIAFGAMPRIILGTAKREDGRRIVVRAKSNIGPDGGGYGYELRQTELDEYPGVVASYVVWGEPLEGTARELLSVAEDVDERRTELDDAADWLRAQLEDGPVQTDDLKATAKAAGYSWRTIERAKSTIGAMAQRQGFGAGGKWSWMLPTNRAKDRQTSPHQFGGLCDASNTLIHSEFSEAADHRPPRPPTVEGGGVSADSEEVPF